MQIDTINQYNRIWGEKTLHPSVSIIDLSKADKAEYETLRTGFYQVILGEYGCGHKALGRKDCDYSDGTILFIAPGESVEMENIHPSQNQRGWMLAFHPHIIPDTSLGLHFDDYSFFSYDKHEALHISRREKNVFMRCLKNINDELGRTVDCHSQTLITKSISLLLDYCKRFYDRQFILRSEENIHLIAKTEKTIYDYFRYNTSKTKGLPSASYCAGLLGISSAYFNDLLKNETGNSFGEYVEVKRIELAKIWLREGEKSVAGIARGLGYSSTEYFSRLFEKVTGYNPSECKFPN